MGFITDALGLTDFEGAEEARKLAKEGYKLAKENNETIKKFGKEQIDFFMGQYNKWNDIFGGNFQDLGSYFKNLTGDTWAAKNAVAIQQQIQKANSELSSTLATRGLAGSGLEASMINQNLLRGSIAKANIFANKDEYVAKQKMEFATLGLQQQQSLMAGINNANNSMLSALGGISAGYTNIANNQAQLGANISSNNSSSMGGILGAGFEGLKYFGFI